jgi:hypothetical protein
VVHENERKARENPKIIPIRTRLKIKKLFDDNFCVRFIFFSFDNSLILIINPNIINSYRLKTKGF